ncbi:MAG: DUF4296 domain-containing protein [Bacteroidota bacterium]
MCLLLFINCGKNGNPGLNLTYQEEKLVRILADIHLAEAVIQSIPASKRDSLSELYYAYIYEIHETNEQEYLRNRKALLSEPSEADKVYEKVIETLSKKEAEKSKKPSSRARNPGQNRDGKGKE